MLNFRLLFFTFAFLLCTIPLRISSGLFPCCALASLLVSMPALCCAFPLLCNAVLGLRGSACICSLPVRRVDLPLYASAKLTGHFLSLTVLNHAYPFRRDSNRGDAMPMLCSSALSLSVANHIFAIASSFCSQRFRSPASLSPSDAIIAIPLRIRCAANHCTSIACLRMSLPVRFSPS